MFTEVPEAEENGDKQPIIMPFKALTFPFDLKKKPKKPFNVEIQLPLGCTFTKDLNKQTSLAPWVPSAA